jgi:nicotinate-nucleotide--dimethylbenzimidazole phosphoribosyltransferase
LRLGEGTGAALGISIVDASIKILKEMATFKEANVSEKEHDERFRDRAPVPDARSA